MYYLWVKTVEDGFPHYAHFTSKTDYNSTVKELTEQNYSLNTEIEYGEDLIGIMTQRIPPLI